MLEIAAASLGPREVVAGSEAVVVVIEEDSELDAVVVDVTVRINEVDVDGSRVEMASGVAAVDGLSVMVTVVVRGEIVVVCSERVWIDVCADMLVHEVPDVLSPIGHEALSFVGQERVIGQDSVLTLSLWTLCLFV